MADHKNDGSSHNDFLDLEPVEFKPKDVSEPTESDFDYLDLMPEDFEPIDVSEPRAPRKEIDVINEALAERRRDWFKSHMVYLYAVIGIVLVALTALGIHFYYRSTNPISRFHSAVAKDFGSSFDFYVELTEDGEDSMKYSGSFEVNRSEHRVEALYNADYGVYTYTGAVYSDNETAVSGSYYDDKWSVRDCTDSAQDFFDFDRRYRSGGFDGGAFLRFTGLTSSYSTREVESFYKVLTNRLSTDSAIADVTVAKTDGGTRYDYDIDLYELLDMVQEDGASVFYRASDYNRFSQLFDENRSVIKNATCTMSYMINSSGYLTSFDLTVTAQGTEYGLRCSLSNFGSARADVPDELLQEAAIDIVQE